MVVRTKRHNVNPKDLLLRAGSLSAAVATLLTATTGDASASQKEMLKTATQATSQATPSGPKRRFVLAPAADLLRDASVHLTGHSSHSSHSSHVSSSSGGGHSSHSSHVSGASFPDYSPASPSSGTSTPAPPPSSPVAPDSSTERVALPASVIPPVYASKCPGVTEHGFTAVELAGCSDAHLKRLLQTIFAGYGYSFKGNDNISVRARKHYSSKPWYKPDADDRSVVLGRVSAVAGANVKLLTRLIQERTSDKVE